jgi:hypothetical protein
MLDHDLDYRDLKHLNCANCRAKTAHKSHGFETFEYGVKSATVLRMECRLCGENVQIPAGMLAHGGLSQFRVIK